jgi:hypothetical protein
MLTFATIQKVKVYPVLQKTIDLICVLETKVLWKIHRKN